MHPNDDLTQLALDHLYGLHDGPESTSVMERLNTPAGREALKKAERIQQLVSAAARIQFPEAKFNIPSTHVTPTKQSHRWIGFVVAASLLGALAIPATAHFLADKHLANQSVVALAQAETARHRFESTLAQWKAGQETAAKELEKAQTDYVRQSNEYVQQMQKVQQEVREKQFNVVVSGPAALTPGVPNQYQIETLSTAGERLAAKVATRVVDQAGRVVYEPPSAESRGLYTLKLPPDLPLTPERDLALEVTAIGPNGPKSELKQKLPLAPPIYFAHLSTDKPMYQPAETVRFRALVLDRFKLQPPAEDLTFTLLVLDPQGSELVNLTGASPPDKLRGIAAGEFSLTESAPGGEYTLRLRESSQRLPEQTRKFIVNRYRPDQLQKELEFTRKSYGPGDEVVAACKASRINGPLANQPVTAAAQVDGVELKVEHAPTTDAKGNILVKFKLPAEIQRGDASIRVSFTDGGAVEPLVKPVPVVVKKLSVEFYPEGGDLIAGVPNRVYVQARTPIGKPAQMSGRIMDKAGVMVAEVATLSDDAEPGINQGQGRFTFTPKKDDAYKLVIDNPSGITDSPMLPAAKDTGAVLETGAGVTADDQPLNLKLTNIGNDRSLMVGAYARGRLLAHERFQAKAGQTQQLSLQPPAGFGGVTRVTVFEERGDGSARELVPLAERLVFRKVNKKVNLTVSANKLGYTPGEKVELKVAAKDEAGKPVSTVTMLGVVNQSVVTMADEKTFRYLPTHFLLTAEVEKAEDLEHVDVLLGIHPKAEAALDLLLGVQGWRRFAEKPEAVTAGVAVAIRGKPIAEPMMRLDSLEAGRNLVKAERIPSLKKAEVQLQQTRSKIAEYQAPREVLMEQLRTALVATNEAEHVQQIRAKQSASARQLGRHALPWLTGLGFVTGLFALVVNFAYGNRSMFGPLGLFIAAIVSFGGWMMIPNEPIAPTRTNTGVQMDQPNEGGVAADRPGLDQADTLAVNPNLFAHYFADLNGAERERLYDWGFRNRGLAMLEDKAGGGTGGFGGGVLKKADAGRPGAPRDGKDDVAFFNPAPVVPPPPAPGAPRGGPAGRSKLPVTTGSPSNQPVSGVATPLGSVEKKEVEGRALGRDPSQAASNVRQIDRFRKGKSLNDKAQDLPAQFPILNSDFAKRKMMDDVALIREISVEELQRGGRFGTNYLGQNALGIAMPAPFVVREYAHVHRASPDNVRDDFAETVFWHPALIVPSEGTSVSFELSDSISRYRVLAEAHTGDGRLGSTKTEIAARKPLTVEPKVPVEVTAGDRVDIPVTIANETDSARDVKLSVESQGLVPVGPQPTLNWKLNGNSRERRLFGYRPLHPEGQTRLRFALAGDDAIEVKIPVVAEGFPITGQFADELRGEAKHAVELPKTWVAGTLKCEVALYPTPLADLIRGLDGLLRDPYGCFEQTSTTNYPNTLILDYLRETGQANPQAVSKAKAFLDKGYGRLTSFEVPANQKREGYEWFGHAPAHEALTAYGLLQFRDMARVTDVDQQMIDRTRNWLMSRKDGQGGFQRAKAALDSFGRAPDNVTNAYIVWAITESGKDDDVTKELDRLETEAATSQDPYFLALVANAMLNRNKAESARHLLDRLATRQAEDGSLTGATKSITGSQGKPLQVETTSLAVLGWLKANRPGDYSQALRKAVKWIAQQRRGDGDFGPTQSTIMALKSLVAYARAYKQPPEAGTMMLKLGDQVLATTDFTADRQEAIILEVPDAEKWLKPGANAISVATTGKNFYPYTLSWSYQTLQPPSVAGCAVKLTTKLDKSDLAEGESTRLVVKVENVSAVGQGMTVAIIGLPAGLKLPDDFKQLREMSRPRDGKPGPIGFFEVRGRELILYWRDLAPDAKMQLAIDVIANVPGRYHGPASRAYLYYDPELKYWTGPLAATVKAKE